MDSVNDFSSGAESPFSSPPASSVYRSALSRISSKFSDGSSTERKAALVSNGRSERRRQRRRKRTGQFTDLGSI